MTVEYKLIGGTALLFVGFVAMLWIVAATTDYFNKRRDK